MKGCFENIDAAVDYIKYMSFDEPNVKVKLYREAGCWYVQGYGGTVCNEPPVGWYCTRNVGHQGPCATHPLSKVEHNFCEDDFGDINEQP